VFHSHLPHITAERLAGIQKKKRMSSNEVTDASLTWNMLDDSQYLLRPGYKFPVPLSYKQMCRNVNSEVRKGGSNPMRPKIRSYIQIGGQKVPKRVSFFCRHRRRNKQKISHNQTDNINNSSPAKDDLTQEGKNVLWTECPCCFSITLETIDESSLYHWMVDVDDEDLVSVGRPRKSCFHHKGHPKRILEDKTIFSQEQAARILETFLQ
jgi:hypothetical protein